jgi:hypothetical protein
MPAAIAGDMRSVEWIFTKSWKVKYSASEWRLRLLHNCHHDGASAGVGGSLLALGSLQHGLNLTVRTRGGGK